MGKIKREGLFTGTKFNATRFRIIGVILGVGILFGGLHLYSGNFSSGYVYKSIDDWDTEYARKQVRITEIEAKRLEGIKKKHDDGGF